MLENYKDEMIREAQNIISQKIEYIDEKERELKRNIQLTGHGTLNHSNLFVGYLVLAIVIVALTFMICSGIVSVKFSIQALVVLVVSLFLMFCYFIVKAFECKKISQQDQEYIDIFTNGINIKERLIQSKEQIVVIWDDTAKALQINKGVHQIYNYDIYIADLVKKIQTIEKEEKSLVGDKRCRILFNCASLVFALATVIQITPWLVNGSMKASDASNEFKGVFYIIYLLSVCICVIFILVKIESKETCERTNLINFLLLCGGGVIAIIPFGIVFLLITLFFYCMPIFIVAFAGIMIALVRKAYNR